MRVLLLSPHTDDVELGAGGTLLKLKENNHEIFIIVFSIAEESLPKNLPNNTLKIEFLNVLKKLDIKKQNYKIFNFKVRHLHKYRQEILDELVKIRKDFSPDLVVGPSLHDHHQDHQIVAHEMVRAFKNNSSIISYELPWNHVTFNTQLFVKLKRRHIEEKIKLLQNYRSQIIIGRPYFSAEFIYGWARMRGVQVKSEFAEAFEVIRWII